jgi:hypothetical protein
MMLRSDVATVLYYSIMCSIFWICYRVVHLNESQTHNLIRTVEIVCYRGLPTVASATAEDPDPLESTLSKKIKVPHTYFFFTSRWQIY